MIFLATRRHSIDAQQGDAKAPLQPFSQQRSADDTASRDDPTRKFARATSTPPFLNPESAPDVSIVHSRFLKEDEFGNHFRVVCTLLCDQSYLEVGLLCDL